MSEDVRYMRTKLWSQAWLACCAASNCDKMESPAKWADQFLSDFDKRFPDVKVIEEKSKKR